MFCYYCSSYLLVATCALLGDAALGLNSLPREIPSSSSPTIYPMHKLYIDNMIAPAAAARIAELEKLLCEFSNRKVLLVDIVNAVKGANVPTKLILCSPTQSLTVRKVKMSIMPS